MRTVKKFIPILENRSFGNDNDSDSSYQEDVVWYCIVSWCEVKSQITFIRKKYTDWVEVFSRTDKINISSSIEETAKLFRYINAWEVCDITHFKELMPEEYQKLNFCNISDEELLWECTNYNNWFGQIQEDTFFWQLSDKSI